MLGDEWLASHFDRLTSREGAYGTGLISLFGGAHGWSGRFGEEKNLSPLAGIELLFLGRPTLSAVTDACHAVSAATYRSISYVICVSASHVLGIP